MATPKVFISYSHKDEVWKDRLVTHLGVLESQGLLQTWDDRRIGAGQEWLEEIQKALEEAQIAVFLVSADSLTSNFILHHEIPRLLERWSRNAVTVFPVIVHSCAWMTVDWLARLQVRPIDGRPLAKLKRPSWDAELAKIALEISDLLRKKEVEKVSGDAAVAPPFPLSPLRDPSSSANRWFPSSGTLSEFNVIAIPPETLDVTLCSYGRLTVIRNRYVQPKEVSIGGAPGAPNRIYVGPADIGKTRAALEWIYGLTRWNQNQWVVLRTDVGTLPETVDRIVLDTTYYQGPDRFTPQRAILFLDDLPLSLPPPNSPFSARDAVRTLFRWFQDLPYFRERRLVGTIRLEDIRTRPDWPNVLPVLGYELELVRLLPLDQEGYRLLWEGMETGAVSRSSREGVKDFQIDTDKGFLAAVRERPANPEAVAVFVRQNALKQKTFFGKDDAQHFCQDAVEIWLQETWPTVRDTYGLAARVFFSLARFLEIHRRSESGARFGAGPLWQFHRAFGPDICRTLGSAEDYLLTLEHLLEDGHAAGESDQWIRPSLDFLLQSGTVAGVDLDLPSLTWFAQRADRLDFKGKWALAAQIVMSERDTPSGILIEDGEWLLGISVGLMGVSNLESDHQSKMELLDRAILMGERALKVATGNPNIWRFLPFIIEGKEEQARDPQQKEGLRNRRYHLYAEFLKLFGDSPDPDLRDAVAETIFNRGCLLENIGKDIEAVAAFEEVAKRFGDSPEYALREHVAAALLGKGRVLERMGRSDDAVSIYEEIVNCFGDSSEVALLEFVARALISKGMILGRAERFDEAVLVLQDFLKRLRDVAPKFLLGDYQNEAIATALFNKGWALSQMGRFEEAITAFQTVSNLFSESRDLFLSEAVARALFEQGVALIQIGRPDEAICAFEMVAKKFGDSPKYDLYEQAVKALYNKAYTYLQAGRNNEALSAFDDFVERFERSLHYPVREMVTSALLEKSLVLAQVEQLSQAISCLDKAIEQLDALPKTSQSSKIAAKVLNHRGCVLIREGQLDEAVSAFSEVVGQFGESTDPILREVVAYALYNKGYTLAQKGQNNAALSIFEEVVKRFGDSSEPALLKPVLSALVEKGMILGKTDCSDEAVCAFAEVVTRFDESPTLALHGIVARALIEQGVYLWQKGKSEEAISSFREIANRFGDSPDSTVREQLVKALSNEGWALGQMGRFEEAVSAYDNIVNRFLDSPEPKLRAMVASAINDKGVILWEAGRGDESVATFQAVAEDFGDSLDYALREHTAKSLSNKGLVLLKMGRVYEALSSYEGVVNRFGDSAEPALRELVATALFNKGVTLGQTGQFDEAVFAYGELVTRFGDSPQVELHKRVAEALFNKGWTLGRIGRSEEAVAVYQELVARFGDSPEPAVREQVAKGLDNLSIALLSSQRWPEALEAAQRAASLGVKRYNLACALARMGRTDEALVELEGCLSRREIARDYVREDPDWETLREKPRFKEVTEEPEASA